MFIKCLTLRGVVFHAWTSLNDSQVARRLEEKLSLFRRVSEKEENTAVGSTWSFLNG